MNRFENFPDLAERMRFLADCRIEGMSLAAWGDFCASLDAALAESFDLGFKAAGGQVIPPNKLEIS